MVMPSYAVAIAYTLCDCVDKGHKAFKEEGGKMTNKVYISTFDALVWQLFASVAIPGFLINRVVHTSEYFVWKKYAQGAKIRGVVPVRYIPVALGLSTIPFIVEPIDHFTSWMMDKTFRKCYYSQ